MAIVTPGDMTATEIMEIKVKAEEMWADGVYGEQYKPQSQTAQAIIANQTAKFRAFDDPSRDNELIVDWIDVCSMTDRACTPSCDLSEAELATNSQPVVPDVCREAGFSIDREKLRTNTYTREELAAQGQMRAVQLLDEYWNKVAVTKLKAFSGDNLYPAPYTFNSGANTTEIPDADYNRKLYAYFLRIAALHRIPSYYFVDNGGLFEDFIDAGVDAGNMDGKGDAERWAKMKFYFDMFGFAAAGITEDTFMVANSSVALKTINRYTSEVVEIGGKVNETVYTIPSRSLPGVVYDATYQLTCEVTGGKKRYRDTWNFETRGGVFLNPAMCNDTTGVLSFSQVG